MTELERPVHLIESTIKLTESTLTEQDTELVPWGGTYPIAWETCADLTGSREDSDGY